ncbi:MAG: ATP-binding protein [Thermoguttaceae bacterium]
MSRLRTDGEGNDVTPRRFVLLHHSNIDGDVTGDSTHLDLMLETDSAAPLATWRLEVGAESVLLSSLTQSSLTQSSLTQRHEGTKKNFNAENTEGRKDAEVQLSIFSCVPHSLLRAFAPSCEKKRTAHGVCSHANREQRFAVATQFRCVPLSPHRREYLTYEGAISGGRGVVKRVAAGEFWGEVVANGAWSIVVRKTCGSTTDTWGTFKLSGDTMTYQPLASGSSERLLVLVRNRVANSLDDAIAARWNPLVVPPLYDLPADDPSIEKLRCLESPAIILTWLSPRAMHALLRFLKFDDLLAESVIVPLTPETNLDSLEPMIVAACGTGQANEVGLATPVDTASDVARRWYPLVDYDACVGCLECVNFCLFGVYDVGQDDKPLVVRPDACRDGCPACARVCPGAAIVFAMHDEPLIAGRLDAAASVEAYRAAESQGETATKTRTDYTASNDSLEQLVNATDVMEI